MLNRIYSLLMAFALGCPMLQAQPTKPGDLPSKATPLPLVKKWKMLDLEGLLGAGLEGGRNYENGYKLLRQATCLACHRYNQEGSDSGPDLSVVATRYGPSDLLLHIIEPGREISDQTRQHEVMLKDGSKVVGRIVSLTADKVTLHLDMKDPKAIRSIDRKHIKRMEPSKVSMMPVGLLDTLNETEILDLLACLLSKGDRDDPMFR